MNSRDRGQIGRLGTTELRVRNQTRHRSPSRRFALVSDARLERTLMRPGLTMMSEMPTTPWRRMSSATRNAFATGVPADARASRGTHHNNKKRRVSRPSGTISRRRSLETTMSVSTAAYKEDPQPKVSYETQKGKATETRMWHDFRGGIFVFAFSFLHFHVCLVSCVFSLFAGGKAWRLRMADIACCDRLRPAMAMEGK